MLQESTTTTLPVVRRDIGGHMTPSESSIGAAASLEQAVMMMSDLGARHLPVLERGRPVGILAERDVALASAFSARALHAIQVAEAMSAVPYCVAPDTPVSEVARHLASRKLDVALVLSGARVLGLFTLVDALQLLATVVGTDGHTARA